MTPQAQGRRVHFVSLGCPKNRVDSELMAKRLLDDGHAIADSAEEADIVNLLLPAWLWGEAFF